MDMTNNVIKAMDGDQEALNELYYSTYPKLRAVAVSILKNEDDADDIVQDSYIKAFSSLHQLDNAKKFEPWLCRIVSNKCKDYLKKNKPLLFSSQTTEDDDEPIEWSIKDESKEYDPEEVLLSEDTRNQIMDLLNSLPDDQRICLVYHVVQEMKISEIAELLEVSESTVKSRINYAKSKMKVKINELEKKGVNLRGFAGFALFPFIRHLFASEAVSIPPISTEIITSSVASAAGTTAAITETVASSSSAVIGETAKSVVGHTIKHIGLKIASGIVAGIVTIATIATVITTVVQKETTSTDNTPPTSNENSNIILNLSDQELLNLNSYLSYFSEQGIQEYPATDDVIFTFALVFNKLYDGPIFDCDSSVCANLYACQCISKADIDNTTDRFFGKTVSIENSEHIVFDDGLYHTEVADGESYYWLSIAKELYVLDRNTYKVTFNIYEDIEGEAGGTVTNLDYYSFDVDKANNTQALKQVGNGYAIIEASKDTREKFVLVEYDEFTDVDTNITTSAKENDIKEELAEENTVVVQPPFRMETTESKEKSDSVTPPLSNTDKPMSSVSAITAPTFTKSVNVYEHKNVETAIGSGKYFAWLSVYYINDNASNKSDFQEKFKSIFGYVPTAKIQTKYIGDFLVNSYEGVQKIFQYTIEDSTYPLITDEFYVVKKKICADGSGWCGFPLPCSMDNMDNSQRVQDLLLEMNQMFCEWYGVDYSYVTANPDKFHANMISEAGLMRTEDGRVIDVIYRHIRGINMPV